MPEVRLESWDVSGVSGIVWKLENEEEGPWALIPAVL
jgi:hypothetical protein